MSELNKTLHGLGFEQLLLALIFLAGYALALSGLAGPRGRRRAALLALLAALAFTAYTRPWVHGALLIAFAVAGMGLFILSVWLVCGVFRLLRPARLEPAFTSSASPVSLPAARTGHDHGAGVHQSPS